MQGLGFSGRHALQIFSEASQAQRGPLRSEKGCQAPKASPSRPQESSQGPWYSRWPLLWGQVCSCQPSSILLRNPNELRLTALPCHVASSLGCPSVGPGRPLSVQLEPSPVIESGES